MVGSSEDLPTVIMVTLPDEDSTNSKALTKAYHSSYGFTIYCTPLSSNFVLLSTKFILLVVSGTLLIHTNIFMKIFKLLLFQS